MKIEVEISEEELKEAVLNVIAKHYYVNYSSDRHHVDRIVADCVRKIIYADKERIVNMIVDRASRECKSKALKKIIESLDA